MNETDYYKHYRYSQDGKVFTMFVGPDMPPHVWDGERMLRLEPADPNVMKIELGAVRVHDTYDFEAMGANLKKDEEKSRGATQEMCEAREIPGVKSNTTVLKPVDNDFEALLTVVEDFVNDTLNRKTIPDHKAVWADVNYIYRLKYWLNKNKESKHYMKHDGRVG